LPEVILKMDMNHITPFQGFTTERRLRPQVSPEVIEIPSLRDERSLRDLHHW